LRDVAHEAGVSVATASRALSGSQVISSETTERVKEAAAALRYRSDHIGRALRSRATLSLGLAVPNITNPFFPALVQAVEVEAKRRGWSMLLADSLDDVEVERENLDLLIGRRVDAIVVSPLHRAKSRPAILAAADAVRVIQLDRQAAATLPYVGVDQAEAMIAVLDHLAAGGRSRIGYVGANTGESTAAERLGAFRAWAGARGMEPLVALADSTLAGGAGGASRLLARSPGLDAIACCNDAIAVGVLSELAARGVGVPGQVAVTGFDDTVVSQVTHPLLTTVRQPLEALAIQAVTWAQHGAAASRERVLLPAQVLPRASSATP
jgi:LacI family transcriptional regulator